MIWYQENISCKNNPSNISLRLIGVFNHPSNKQSDQSVIEVFLLSTDTTTLEQRSVLLYHKDPNMLVLPDEYIDPDLILAKYNNIIVRYTAKIAKSEISSLLKY